MLYKKVAETCLLYKGFGEFSKVCSVEFDTSPCSEGVFTFTGSRHFVALGLNMMPGRK